MKKIILFTISFLLISLIQLNAQESTNYCGLEKIKNIKEIRITKRDFDNPQEKSPISLNETQKQEFLDKIKISRQEKYIKVLLKYEVSVSYDTDEKETFYMTGRIIKKQDGTTYKLDNSMTLFLDLLFSEKDSSKKYKERIIETSKRRIHVYQANYSRKDLIHIEGVTSSANPEGVYDLTWEIGQELINAQDNFSKKKDFTQKEKIMQSYSENYFFDKIEDLVLQKEKDGDFCCRITKPHVCDDDSVYIYVVDEVSFERVKPTILLIAKKFLAILKTVRDYTEKEYPELGYDVGLVCMEDDTHFYIDMWEEAVNNQFDVCFSCKDGVITFENFNRSVEVGIVVE